MAAQEASCLPWPQEPLEEEEEKKGGAVTGQLSATAQTAIAQATAPGQRDAHRRGLRPDPVALRLLDATAQKWVICWRPASASVPPEIAPRRGGFLCAAAPAPPAGRS